jgi:Immunoglobulin I-set domain
LIRHGPSHQRVRAGSTATFRCLFDIVPPATVSIVWSKDDRPLTSDQGQDQDQGRGRVTFADSGQLLMIANTSIADTGLYTCSARDSGNKNDASTATASGRLVVEGN